MHTWCLRCAASILRIPQITHFFSQQLYEAHASIMHTLQLRKVWHKDDIAQSHKVSQAGDKIASGYLIPHSSLNHYTYVVQMLANSFKKKKEVSILSKGKVGELCNYISEWILNFFFLAILLIHKKGI